MRREGHVQAYVLVFVRLKRHGKGAEQRRIVGLFPISRRVFLSCMIFTAVCCEPRVFNTAFMGRPDSWKEYRGRENR
jgi:hypothetical protein